MRQTCQCGFGQPRGLTVLLLTEMWEEFSYFGMRTIPVLYLTKELAWSAMSPSALLSRVAAVCLPPAAALLALDRPIRRAEAAAQSLTDVSVSQAAP